MTRRFGTAITLAATGMLLEGVPAAALASEPATIVIHVDDCVGVPPPVLAHAKGYVEATFQAASVRIEWIEGALASQSGVAEGALGNPRHFALVIANGPVRAPENGQSRQLVTDGVLGSAAHAIGRAHVFFDRVLAVSETHPVDVAVVLAHVIAHEVGHLLLPPNSHSQVGIMRATVQLRQVVVRRFTDAQSILIRAALSGHLADH